MKAVNLGGGPRGRLLAITVAVAVLTMITALFLGGCGGDDKQASTGSQLDDQSGTTTNQDVSSVGGTGGAEVLAGYTDSQCVAEMTTRYGDAATASQVCDSLRTDYGSSTQTPGFAAMVSAVEAKLGVKPLPDVPLPPGPPQPGPPVTPAPTDTPSDGGWGGQTITVPPQSPEA